MIAKFFFICKDCNSKHFGDINLSTQCNIHNTGKTLILTCFNCGAEEEFLPDIMSKPTKEEYKLLKEKEKIEEEIEIKKLKN